MKIIYVGIAFVFLGLSILGAILPGLPVTPFILGASYFGTRGSDRFSDRLKSSKMYTHYFKEIQDTKAMTVKQKVQILAMASLSIGLIIVFTPITLLRYILVSVIAVKYYVFIWVIPTRENDL